MSDHAGVAMFLLSVGIHLHCNEVPCAYRVVQIHIAVEN
jgi:hypothetical protein